LLPVSVAESAARSPSAERLSAEGASIAMLARSRTELAAAAASIRASGGNVIAIPTDIADPSQVIAAIDQAGAALGPISILLPRQQCRDQPGDRSRQRAVRGMGSRHPGESISMAQFIVRVRLAGA
jgi:hypothetical protein